MPNHDFITALVSGHGECGLNDKCTNGVRDEIPEMRAGRRIPPGSEYTDWERENEHERNTEFNTDLSGELIRPKSATGDN